MPSPCASLDRVGVGCLLCLIGRGQYSLEYTRPFRLLTPFSFLSLSLSLSLALQTEHHTAPRSQWEDLPYRDTSSIYACNQSHVDAGWRGPNNLRRHINVWNEADGFDGDSQLSWLVGQLPMQELFDKYYVGELMRDPSSRDSNRGNYQRNFGYCCGHNQARRTHENVQGHYGCHVPQMLKDTMDPLVRQAFVAMSAIGRHIGVPWMQDDYLQANPQDAERVEAFAGAIDPMNGIELKTTAFSRVLDGSVDIHTDRNNCPRLQAAWSTSAIMVAPDGQ